MDDPLLTIKVTTIVPAPLEVLRERLHDKLAERDRRAVYPSWAETVSGKWLQEDIAKLQAAIAAAAANKGKENG